MAEVSLRLSESEKRVLKQDADRHAVSVNEYLRRLVVAAHQQKLELPLTALDAFDKQQRQR